MGGQECMGGWHACCAVPACACSVVVVAVAGQCVVGGLLGLTKNLTLALTLTLTLTLAFT